MARPETLQKSLPGLRCILAYFWPHLRLYRRLVIGSLLALARAAIRKAPILVLDEPERLHSERTTLPITHDLSPAASAHVILYAPKACLAVVNEFRPQLLHAHFATEATAAALDLAAEHSIPFTFPAHGYDIHRKAPLDFGPRAAAGRAVVTVSEANAAYIARAFGVPRSHIRVIPCGVDTDRFRPLAHAAEASEPASSGIPAAAPPAWHQAPLIVCVARLVAVKNLPLLLESCALLKSRGVNFRCALIGDGPCRSELEAASARLGLQDIVQMPGAAEQQEVLQWWQRATVGVLTSDNEGMPVSLMEAAACGVPAVATAVGGVPELVQDGATGLLVPAGDAAALASALERLLLDRSLRERLSLAARGHAEAKFSVRRQVDQLLAL